MPDPTPFLSSIAAVSATMVAIIGGLLVARFVSLDSEQQGAEQLLDQARARLKTAQQRADEARQRWRDWEINDFFGSDVLKAVVGGERDVAELRRVGGYTVLTDAEITGIVQLVANEYFKAHQTLQTLRVGDEDAPSVDWPDFKRQWTDAPEISWDEVWEIAYDEMVASDHAARLPRSLVDPLESMRPYIGQLSSTAQTQYDGLRIQRRDALIATVERTEQRVEDLQAEQEQFEAARDAVVKPKGLGGGLAVLSVFTIVGVIVPLWQMSRGPTVLTPGLGEVVFWLFFSGLVLLLAYMSILAMLLSKRGRRLLLALDARLPRWVRKVLRRPEVASPEVGTPSGSASGQPA